MSKTCQSIFRVVEKSEIASEKYSQAVQCMVEFHESTRHRVECSQPQKS